MSTVILFLTDGKTLDLTRHALAAAMLTQGEAAHYALYTRDCALPPDDPLIAHARRHGLSLACTVLADDAPAVLLRKHITDTALLKIGAIDDLCRRHDRVVYMDGDILLMQPVDYAAIELGTHPIGAVYDFVDASGVDNPDLWHNCRTNRVSPHYFNTGMILVDGQRWDSGFIERYNHWKQVHRQVCPYRHGCRTVDQCIWNLTFQNDWQRLPLDLNYQACAMFTPGWDQARVRHYVGKKKFLPLQVQRNDPRDIALINAARRLLLLPALDLPFNRPVRLANIARNRKASATMIRAMGMLEASMAHPFEDERQPLPPRAMACG